MEPLQNTMAAPRHFNNPLPGRERPRGIPEMSAVYGESALRVGAADHIFDRRRDLLWIPIATGNFDSHPQLAEPLGVVELVAIAGRVTIGTSACMAAEAVPIPAWQTQAAHLFRIPKSGTWRILKRSPSSELLPHAPFSG